MEVIESKSAISFSKVLFEISIKRYKSIRLFRNWVRNGDCRILERILVNSREYIWPFVSNNHRLIR